MEGFSKQSRAFLVRRRPSTGGLPGARVRARDLPLTLLGIPSVTPTSELTMSPGSPHSTTRLEVASTWATRLGATDESGDAL